MMIRLTIDENVLEASEGSTILETAQGAGIHIPTLCYNKYLKPYGGCRMCLVEVSHPGRRPSLVSSCTYPVEDGLVVDTHSERVMEGRRFIVGLLIARCPDSEEILQIGREYGISAGQAEETDPVSQYLLTRAKPRGHTKCILCGLCVRVCEEVVQRTALSRSGRGPEKKVETPFNRISETCIGCGSCAYLCPTNTITIEEKT